MRRWRETEARAAREGAAETCWNRAGHATASLNLLARLALSALDIIYYVKVCSGF